MSQRVTNSDDKSLCFLAQRAHATHTLSIIHCLDPSWFSVNCNFLMICNIKKKKNTPEAELNPLSLLKLRTPSLALHVPSTRMRKDACPCLLRNGHRSDPSFLPPPPALPCALFPTRWDISRVQREQEEERQKRDVTISRLSRHLKGTTRSPTRARINRWSERRV